MSLPFIAVQTCCGFHKKVLIHLYVDVLTVGTQLGALDRRLERASDLTTTWTLKTIIVSCEEEVKAQDYQQLREGCWKSKKRKWDRERTLDEQENWSGEEDERAGM